MSSEAKELSISVSPEEYLQGIDHCLAQALQCEISSLPQYRLLRKSIDARGKKPLYHLKFLIGEDIHKVDYSFKPLPLKNHKESIIVGSGPAGLFAALTLLEHGIKPIVIERGKPVQERRRDIASLMKQSKLNPESNYCFGEGGAGTFSDGKLYTRSKKRGTIERVLQLLHQFGAREEILYEAHPHIGSNQLPKVVSNIKKAIIDAGGEFHFETCLKDFEVENGSVSSIITNKGELRTENLILATGHSARDIFTLLGQKKLEISAKPFAVGVRLELPQEIVDKRQHRKFAKVLPPASFSFVCQAHQRGVYTFCMCPGGIICPASTHAEELVVNGWSPSKRNSYFANSGFVVEVPLEELLSVNKSNLAGVEYQQAIEKKAFTLGGGKFQAPAQRALDFLKHTVSASLPSTSYQPGITSCDLREVFPSTISSRLQLGIKELLNKNPAYAHSETTLIACETRTSSPISIPRNESGQHPQISGLYPCGEGAGYAGGILSAALDGTHIASMIALSAGASKSL